MVRTLVAERRRRQRLSVEQAEDLLQECLLHWIQVRQRLSPQARDAGAKYLHRVIENFLADLTRKDLAAKRGSGIYPLSLDFPVGSMEDSDQEDATTLGQLLAEDGSHAELNTSQVTDLRMDLRRIVSTLTERQQILCKLLGQEGLTPAEAAQVMGVARSTVYLELTQVRERLRDAGLQSYLKG